MLQEIKGSVLYVSSFFPLVLYIAVFAWGLISEIQQLDTACDWQGIELVVLISLVLGSARGATIYRECCTQLPPVKQPGSASREDHSKRPEKASASVPVYAGLNSQPTA